MSTIKVDTIKDTNNVEVYTCKAWVTFNSDAGAIGASGNVTSITDVAAGETDINFSITFSDTYYAVVCGGNQFDDTAMRYIGPSGYSSEKSSTSVRIYHGYYSGTSAALFDYANYSHHVAVFR